MWCYEDTRINSYTFIVYTSDFSWSCCVGQQAVIVNFRSKEYNTQFFSVLQFLSISKLATTLMVFRALFNFSDSLLMFSSKFNLLSRVIPRNNGCSSLSAQKKVTRIVSLELSITISLAIDTFCFYKHLKVSFY